MVISRIDVEGLTKLGIPPGPLYRRIKAGNEVTLPSGETVQTIVTIY